MARHTKVSIITPTYNHEAFISQCIESVLGQTYTNWEQIIIDDGSKDKTQDLVRRYADDRIKYIRQDNRGIWCLGEIYNKALSESKGDLIAILEGDDFWPPYKLRKQIPAFFHQNVVLSWGKAYITKSNGEPIMVSPRNIANYMNLSRNDVLKRLLYQNPISSSTVICRKSALESIGGFKQPKGLPYVDLPTWLELSLIGDFFVIDDILGCYRRHGQQITATMKAGVNAGHSYPIKFFMNLPEKQRKELGINVKDLMRHKDKVDSEFFYQSGRAHLLDGNWIEAREEFKDALHKGCTATRMKAIAGLICSYCRTDVEWLTTITKEPRLDQMA